MKFKLLAVFALACCTGSLFAQAPAAAAPTNPIVSGQKMLFSQVKRDILGSAEEMPEANFAFKPTPEVRSFGQVLAHVADSQYEFCTALLPKPATVPEVEKTVTTKAGLIQALKDSFAYCDKAYEISDADAAGKVKFFGDDYARATILSFNTAHTFEHYGNLITYLRLKGLVPPSSQGR